MAVTAKPQTTSALSAVKTNIAKVAITSAAPPFHAESPPESAFTITATQPSRPPRALKYGDTFVVLDSRGNIGGASGGLFHRDTRHLSRLELRVNDGPPLLLGSNVRDDNSAFFVDLTNPDLMDGQRIVMEKDRVHILRTIFLWRDTAYQRLGVRNYGDQAIDLRLAIHFESDFADLFEVRGARRDRRGTASAKLHGDDRVILSYNGLDGKVRGTALNFDPPPDELTTSSAVYELHLKPGEMRPLFIAVSCDRTSSPPLPFLRGLIAARREMRESTREQTSVQTSNERFNAVLCRSAADLAMLMTDTPQGRYPYAGIPWYSTTFGRDGLITALQMLWWSPDVARGVLRRLAAYQATTTDPLADAQPGRDQDRIAQPQLRRLPIDVEVRRIVARRTVLEYVPPPWIVGAHDRHVIRHQVEHLPKLVFAQRRMHPRMSSRTAEVLVDAPMVNYIVTMGATRSRLQIGRTV